MVGVNDDDVLGGHGGCWGGRFLRGYLFVFRCSLALGGLNGHWFFCVACGDSASFFAAKQMKDILAGITTIIAIIGVFLLGGYVVYIVAADIINHALK